MFQYKKIYKFLHKTINNKMLNASIKNNNKLNNINE